MLINWWNPRILFKPPRSNFFNPTLNGAAPIPVLGDEHLAQQDCEELLHNTIYHLNAMLVNMKATYYLSSKSMLSISLLCVALTNNDTWLDSFHNFLGGTGSSFRAFIFIKHFVE